MANGLSPFQFGPPAALYRFPARALTAAAPGRRASSKPISLREVARARYEAWEPGDD
ncbi:MAG TPA: hypothetical protein VF652_07390 [Allosphingosinicella sp.]|jgi:hypothetical protein